MANLLRKVLPDATAYKATRWKNTTMQQYIYRRTRTHPEKVKHSLLKRVRKELGPDFDVETHFTPTYNPWDQRLCLVPNGDLFRAITSGKASVVTDRIDTFTAGGIRLASGTELEADIVVTATRLEVHESDSPAAITLLQVPKLEERQIDRVADALRDAQSRQDALAAQRIAKKALFKAFAELEGEQR